MNHAWSNQAPGKGGVAQGPTTGTTAAPVKTTIPTDPFHGVPSLPGARDWGLGLMTPLSASSVRLPANATTRYKAVLAAGDQLAIKVPDTPAGHAERDDHQRHGGDRRGQLPALARLHAVPCRQADRHLPAGADVVANSGRDRRGRDLRAPARAAQQPDGNAHELHGEGVGFRDHTSGTPTATPTWRGSTLRVGTAAAAYWPLWSDATYFPVPAGANAPTWAPELNAAYQNLVNNIPGASGLTDFANIINAGVTLPIGTPARPGSSSTWNRPTRRPTAPPRRRCPTPARSPCNLPPGTTPQDAVYRFLYNANLLRQTFYEVLFGGSPNPSSLQEWVQEVINGIGGASNVSVGIANTIFNGLTEQVQNLPLNTPNPATQSAAQIAEGGLEWAVGGILAAVGSLLGPEGAVIGAALGGAAASIANSFTNMAGSSDTLNLTVPVTPITNNLLRYSKLNTVATSLNATMIQQWNGDPRRPEQPPVRPVGDEQLRPAGGAAEDQLGAAGRPGHGPDDRPEHDPDQRLLAEHDPGRVHLEAGRAVQLPQRRRAHHQPVVSNGQPERPRRRGGDHQRATSTATASRTSPSPIRAATT